MMYIPHCLCAFGHMRNGTIGESSELVGCDVEPFFLLCAFDELSMPNGAPDGGIDDIQSCRG
jgi:hypothetical protein